MNVKQVQCVQGLHFEEIFGRYDQNYKKKKNSYFNFTPVSC